MVEKPTPEDTDEDLIQGQKPEADRQAEALQERVEHLDDKAGLLKEAWQQTLDDMEAIAEERRANGWDVLEIPAVDAGPIGRGSEEDEGEFGMEFVIPDNYVEEFSEAFEAGDFPRFDVYRAEESLEVFIVEELLDPETEQAILLAGGYHKPDQVMCAWTAREENEMYTFVRTLDGTRHGAFRHENYEKFFPAAEDLPEDPTQIEYHSSHVA